MFTAEEIVLLQDECVERWHRENLDNPYSGILATACQQHQFNYQLWHQEDIARSLDVTDAEIATVKRAIDRLNQLRNDWIEKVDDWLTDYIESKGIQPKSNARQNSETPGSIVDRLSIISLRIYHLAEQLSRVDVDEAHREKVQGKLNICCIQQKELAHCLDQLLAEITSGKAKHRTYRQFKMYNDPTLNPYLYQRSKIAA